MVPLLRPPSQHHQPLTVQTAGGVPEPQEQQLRTGSGGRTAVASSETNRPAGRHNTTAPAAAPYRATQLKTDCCVAEITVRTVS